MDGAFLLRGCIIGLSVAAPIGPIGLLCVRRTLAKGRAAGLATGLGAVTVHALYGGVAVLGIGGVAGVALGQHRWLHVGVAALLLYLGARTFRAGCAAASGAAGISLRGAYLSALALALLNPMTVLSFAALFAGVGLASTHGDRASACLLLTGELLGATLWWCALSGGVSLLRARVTARRLVWVNKVSGAAIAVCGVLALVGAVW